MQPNGLQKGETFLQGCSGLADISGSVPWGSNLSVLLLTHRKVKKCSAQDFNRLFSQNAFEIRH